MRDVHDVADDEGDDGGRAAERAFPRFVSHLRVRDGERPDEGLGDDLRVHLDEGGEGDGAERTLAEHARRAFVAVEASGVHRATRGAGRRRALLELEGELRRQEIPREARGGAAVLPVAVEDAVELHVRVAHESIVDEHFVLVIALAADVGEPVRREGRSRGGRTRVGGKTQPRNPRLERRRLATGTILRGPEVVAPRRCRRAHTDLRARASTGIEARRLEAPLRLGRTSRASRKNLSARATRQRRTRVCMTNTRVSRDLATVNLDAPRAVASPTKRYNSSSS